MADQASTSTLTVDAAPASRATSGMTPCAPPTYNVQKLDNMDIDPPKGLQAIPQLATLL